MSSDKTARPESGLWKDFVDKARVETLAWGLREVWPKFDAAGFVEAVCDQHFLTLELKSRIAHVADRLEAFLPKEYSKAAAILVQAAPSLKGFENWVLTSYVEKFGLDHFDVSVEALKELTKYGSSEFAIRPYMIRYTDRIMPLLHQWATDPNEHVRRLAAEGSRPRGVWVAHIDAFRKDPTPVLVLLEKLKSDPSLYVRKAVANNLNDISKDHPKAVIRVAREWFDSGDTNAQWIVKRACRSLIKKGYPEVFPIFGFAANPHVQVDQFQPRKKRVTIGKDLEIVCRIVSTSKRRQKLAVDYRVHFVKKNGKASPKVFKWTEKALAAGETLELSTALSLKNMTTRKHYPGNHEIELVINGKSQAGSSFKLLA
jgi:3-methyladenine DNA glycosylase AlkC